MSPAGHIRLELLTDGDSLSGTAIGEQESREFHGWLGLIGAIEALLPTPVTPNDDEEQIP